MRFKIRKIKPLKYCKTSLRSLEGKKEYRLGRQRRKKKLRIKKKADKYLKKGYWYRTLSKYNEIHLRKAISYYRKALNCCEDISYNPLRLARSLESFAKIYLKKNDTSEAIAIYKKSIKVFKKYKDTQSDKHRIYKKLARLFESRFLSVYYGIKALKYREDSELRKAILKYLNDQIKDNKKDFEYYENLALTGYYCFYIEKKFTKGLDYANLVLKKDSFGIAKIDFFCENFKRLTYKIIGHLYKVLAVEMEKDDLKKAISYLEKAIECYKVIGHNSLTTKASEILDRYEAIRYEQITEELERALEEEFIDTIKLAKKLERNLCFEDALNFYIDLTEKIEQSRKANKYEKELLKKKAKIMTKMEEYEFIMEEIEYIMIIYEEIDLYKFIQRIRSDRIQELKHKINEEFVGQMILRKDLKAVIRGDILVFKNSRLKKTVNSEVDFIVQ